MRGIGYNCQVVDNEGLSFEAKFKKEGNFIHIQEFIFGLLSQLGVNVLEYYESEMANFCTRK